jgi:hypothetical protein
MISWYLCPMKSLLLRFSISANRRQTVDQPWHKIPKVDYDFVDELDVPRPLHRQLNLPSRLHHSCERASFTMLRATRFQWKNVATGGAAAAFAVGSGAWYYHMFGRSAHAMTPAEEGYALIWLRACAPLGAQFETGC